MDSSLQTSFIPKKPIASPSTPNRRGGLSLVSLLAVIIFVISVFLSGATFGYKKILEGQKSGKTEDLKQARNAFLPATIQELRRSDKRLVVSNTILDNHLAPSAVFELLSERTLKSIKFDSFNFNGDLTNEGYMKITLRGKARNYASVALQADEFGSSSELRQVSVSGLSLDERGNIAFTINALVDPKLIKYRNSGSQTSAPNNTDTSTSSPSVEGTVEEETQTN